MVHNALSLNHGNTKDHILYVENEKTLSFEGEENAAKKSKSDESLAVEVAEIQYGLTILYMSSAGRISRKNHRGTINSFPGQEIILTPLLISFYTMVQTPMVCRLLNDQNDST